MLWAHGILEADACSVGSTIGLERAFRIYIIERHGLVWDTRVAPARSAGGAGLDVLYVVLEGAMRWHDDGLAIAAGSACLATEEQVDGSGGTRRHTFATPGAAFRCVELRFAGGHSVAAPRLVTPSADTFAACAELVRARETDRDAAAARLLATLAELAPGLAITAAEPPHLARCWAALEPHFMQLQPAPSLQEIADRAGISVRQLSRDVVDLLNTFAIGLGDSFRDVVSDVRLRWAVLLLSAPALPIHEIARASGYGSLQALGRAFRDAGLPSPSAVRKLYGQVVDVTKLVA